MKKNKIKTIHTSRTMMFAELEKVLDFSGVGNNFFESLGQNITGKKSSSGVEKTARYLKRLYGFDINYAPFKALRYFWKIVDARDKPLLAFIYAINHDDLLEESLQVLQKIKESEKVGIGFFEEMIEQNHPNQYSANTRKSMAQNIASSWKQAGFIEGKVKNIRRQPEITFKVACFAFVIAYINGDRGDFIWDSISVRALGLYESNLRELAIECAKRDLMQYQYAGSVTAISFNSLLNKIEEYGV